jgi:diguanylate cyclase (GGDEF)-like protein
MLGRCTEAIVEHFDAAFARVWTLGDDGKTLELQVSSGTSGEADGEHNPVSVGQPGIGRIASERRPHITNSVVGDPVVGHQSWVGDAGMVAFAGYPLVVDDRLVGVMALAARRALSSGVAATLGSVAREIALGIARKQSDEALLHQALHDSLTGLANRALVFNRIEQALTWTSRANTSVSILFLDLDRFKLVNDSHGHPTGDAVLIEVARRLRAVAGATDTVGRFGGDEFVVMAETDPNDEIGPVRLAERLLAAIKAPFAVGSRDLFLSASIGIATGHTAGSAAMLLRDADAAMHQAKEKGRARVELFDEVARNHLQRRLGVEGELRRALTRDELVVFYQPVVSLATGSIVGAEALVRWQHPDRGLVAPGDFIPLAEEAGLIGQIGAWVLGQACGDAAAWRKATGRDLFVSVNVSGVQLSAPGLPETVEGALQSSTLAPERLTLEITETSLIRDLGSLTDSLLELKGHGIRIAIDDFGTGYSSLTYLRRLPIDVVKVDKAFIDRLGLSSEDSAILAAIITMGRSLGFQVVAEGVEQSEQLSALRALSCDLGQGYFFAKPLPNDMFVDVVSLGRHW